MTATQSKEFSNDPNEYPDGTPVGSFEEILETPLEIDPNLTMEQITKMLQDFDYRLSILENEPDIKKATEDKHDIPDTFLYPMYEDKIDLSDVIAVNISELSIEDHLVITVDDSKVSTLVNIKLEKKRILPLKMALLQYLPGESSTLAIRKLYVQNRISTTEYIYSIDPEVNPIALSSPDWLFPNTEYLQEIHMQLLKFLTKGESKLEMFVEPINKEY